MKNVFIIICSIIIPVFSLKEIIPVFSLKETTPNLCINCKFFMNNFISGNKYGKCSLFPKRQFHSRFEKLFPYLFVLVIFYIIFKSILYKIRILNEKCEYICLMSTRSSVFARF